MPLQDGGTEWDCPKCGKDCIFECDCPGEYRYAQAQVIRRMADKEDREIMASTEGVREEAARSSVNKPGPINQAPGNGPQQAFGSGATRSSSEGKVDYEGHIDPEVLAIYGDYMNRHRIQRDGKLRASDNWQNGIPIPAYMKSLVRHTFELWRMYRGHAVANPDANGKPFTFEEVTSAILFNVMGLMREMSRGGALHREYVTVEMRKNLEASQEKAKQEAILLKCTNDVVTVDKNVPGRTLRDIGIAYEGRYTMTVERER